MDKRDEMIRLAHELGTRLSKPVFQTLFESFPYEEADQHYAQIRLIFTFLKISKINEEAIGKGIS